MATSHLFLTQIFKYLILIQQLICNFFCQNILLSLKNVSTIVFDNLQLIILSYSQKLSRKRFLLLNNSSCKMLYILVTVILQKLSKAPKTGSEINQYYLLIS